MIDVIIKNFNDKVKVCVNPDEVKVLVKKTEKEIEEYIIKNNKKL